MDDVQRTEKYAKRPVDEQRIAQMNELLRPAQASLEQHAPQPAQPIVLVIGAPRAGTTLAGQMLAATGGFAYASNFLARFWQTPAVGAIIEQALKIRENDGIDFSSTHGVTKGWSNSHEFGYYWSSWFDRGQTTHRLAPAELAQIDAAAMLRSLGALEAVRHLPFVFKNNTWCTLQAAYLARTLPTSLFVVCRRNPLFIAQSILMARRERYGDERQWWSVRPSTYETIIQYSPQQQVVFQALEIQREMDDELRLIAPHRLVHAPYERLCAEPRRIVAEVVERCESAGARLKLERTCPEAFESTDVRRLQAAEWRLLERALEDYPAFRVRVESQA
ncbi:sulfotransferase [Achromobacter xylosoxidans]